MSRESKSQHYGNSKYTNNYANKLIRSTAFFMVFGLISLSPESAYSAPVIKTNTAFDQFSDTSIDSSQNRLNVRLFAQNENLVLRLSNGYHAVFKPKNLTQGHQSSIENTHHHETLGEIKTLSSRRIWAINAGSSVEFHGSYPINFTVDDQSGFSLTYPSHGLASYESADQNRNSSTTDEQLRISNALALMREIEIATCPTPVTPVVNQTGIIDEQLIPEQSPSSNEIDSCENPESPLPLGFGETTAQNNLHINARPSDCHSYFTAYSDIDRGTEIEKALAEHTPYIGSDSGGHSFPIADYWNNGNVFVLISRDLTAASYNTIENPNGLYDQLMQDGENINNNLIVPHTNEGQITHTELGVTTTLQAEDAQHIYLDVVVQYGVMTPAQQAILDQAAIDLLDAYGIVVRIIEIP